MAAQADEITERLPDGAAEIAGNQTQTPSGRLSTIGLLIGVLSLILASAFILSGPSGPGRTVALLLLSCLATAMAIVVRRMTNLNARAATHSAVQTQIPTPPVTAMPGLAL